MGAFLWLLALIPGAGPVVAVGASAIGTVAGRVLSNKYVLMAIAITAGLIAADIHGHRVERRKCDARMETARQDAETARAARDAEIKVALEQKYGPEIARLAAQSDSFKQQVADYEKTLLADKSRPQCQLGAEPLRLRRRP
jgi:hypothetical protein